MIAQIEELVRDGKTNEACNLIKQALKSGIDFQGRHITCAHALLCNSDWQEITSLLPKDTNSFVSSGWLTSVSSGRPVNAQGEPIPWLTYSAIDFLDLIVKPDWLVFEWGAGNSTRWWANKISHVYAMESNAAWFNEVKANLPENSTIFHKTSEEEYVNFINTFEDNFFDVIVIDADFRNQCAKVSVPKLKHNGFIVFDNSDVTDYDEGVLFLNNQGFYRIDFWGLIPSYLYKNCTSIFYRNPEIFKNLALPSIHNSSVGVSCAQACSSSTNTSSVKASTKEQTDMNIQDLIALERYKPQCNWVATYGFVTSLAKTIDAKRICEIGVALGYHAEQILDSMSNVEYQGVDPFLAGYDPNDCFVTEVAKIFNDEPQLALDRLFRVVAYKLNCYDGRANLLRQPSAIAASRFVDGYFDLIYIDGDHTYSGVMADLHAWYGKVRRGGILCGCLLYTSDAADE